MYGGPVCRRYLGGSTPLSLGILPLSLYVCPLLISVELGNRAVAPIPAGEARLHVGKLRLQLLRRRVGRVGRLRVWLPDSVMVEIIGRPVTDADAGVLRRL